MIRTFLEAKERQKQAKVRVFGREDLGDAGRKCEMVLKMKKEDHETSNVNDI